jgi:hypothetical protein
MTLAATEPDKRFCFVFCGRPTPECHCLARMQSLGAEFEAAIFDDLDSLYENEQHESE